MADALTNLASNMALAKGESVSVPVCQRWVVPFITESPHKVTNIVFVLPVSVEEWRQPLIDYLEHEKLPNDPRHRFEVRR